MSLINDALKKAQRERTAAPEHPATVTPPSPPPPAGHGPARRGELRSRSNPWPALLFVLALVGGGAAVWFLKPSGQPAPAAIAAATTSNQTPATPTSAPVATAPAAAAESAPATVQLQFNTPSQPPAAAIPQPAQPVPAPVPVATTTAPVAIAPTAQPSPVPAPAEPLKISLQMEDPRILAFLDAARINGIRAVADDAKLSMNNKVYRAGAVVDRELGLKLVQILPNELVFEDARGIQYRKLL